MMDSCQKSLIQSIGFLKPCKHCSVPNMSRSKLIRKCVWTRDFSIFVAKKAGPAGFTRFLLGGIDCTTSRSLKVDTRLKLISLKVDYDFGLASLRNTPFFLRNLREGLTFLHEILARSNFAPKTPPETPFDEVDTLEIDWVLGLAQMDFLWGFLEREAKSPETPLG